MLQASADQVQDHEQDGRNHERRDDREVMVLSLDHFLTVGQNQSSS
jgi:hypothetical protein